MEDTKKKQLSIVFSSIKEKYSFLMETHVFYIFSYNNNFQIKKLLTAPNSFFQYLSLHVLQLLELSLICSYNLSDCSFSTHSL